MIDRYATKDMKRIWSDQNKFKTWEKVEIAVAEAMVEKGIVPKKSFEVIKKNVEVLNTVKLDKLMLTSEENIVYVSFSVQYRISNLEHYLFYKKSV